MQPRIVIQREDFCLATEYQRLAAAGAGSGAIVTFAGLVRDMAADSQILGLELEHYPAMTEKVLGQIVEEAADRWPLRACTLIHRVGPLLAGDQIVLVAVAAAHRLAAFEACHFIMDQLKIRAPFWKRELMADGQRRWVEAREQDRQAAARWQQEPN